MESAGQDGIPAPQRSPGLWEGWLGRGGGCLGLAAPRTLEAGMSPQF